MHRRKYDFWTNKKLMKWHSIWINKLYVILSIFFCKTISSVVDTGSSFQNIEFLLWQWGWVERWRTPPCHDLFTTYLNMSQTATWGNMENVCSGAWLRCSFRLFSCYWFSHQPYRNVVISIADIFSCIQTFYEFSFVEFARVEG